MTNPYEIEDFGAPCGNCGDDSVGQLRVQGEDHPVALCGSCMDHAIVLCGNCEQWIWDDHRSFRTFGTATKYCKSCNDAVEEAIANVSLPDMNQVRR
jgi:hypothetical protein